MIVTRVVGLDLSITATGIAYSDGSTSVIKTGPKGKDWRLVEIRDWICAAVGGPALMGSPTAPPCTLVVIEDLPVNAKAAGVIGMVQGVVRELLTRAEVPYVLISPASLKKYATGKGNATKADMRMALFQRAGIDLRDDNEVDAWWLRAMGLDYLGKPVVMLPKTHRESLGKIFWPALPERVS